MSNNPMVKEIPWDKKFINFILSQKKKQVFKRPILYLKKMALLVFEIFTDTNFSFLFSRVLALILLKTEPQIFISVFSI